MRVILNGIEFYVFKDIFYKQPTYYYNRQDTTLADKFFVHETFRVSEENKQMLDIITSSSKVPELVQAPIVTTANKEEQIEELRNYLKAHFSIEMDECNRFFAKVKVSRKSKSKKSIFGLKNVIKTIYFSFEEVIQLYYKPHSNFGISFNESDNAANDLSKAAYINSKLRVMNSLLKIEKKFVYLGLKRTSKKYGYFILDNPTVVTLPK